MKLYTIGYEGLNQNAFLSWLKRYDIDIVIDVRQRPQSRKKGFSKNALRESLEENDINIKGYPSLGASKELRDSLYSSGDYKSFFKKYRESIRGNDEQVNELYSFIKCGKRIVLLCFEHDPDTCHRSVLAEQIKRRSDNGFKVNHIVPL